MTVGIPLEDWVASHRGEIDQVIHTQVPNPGFAMDDAERILWVSNYEPLYLMAQQEGVEV